MTQTRASHRTRAANRTSENGRIICAVMEPVPVLAAETTKGRHTRRQPVPVQRLRTGRSRCRAHQFDRARDGLQGRGIHIMRYADMRDMTHERAGLLDKKRLGKNQKARLATLSTQLDDAHQPPATPPREVTGLDEHGQASGDRDGNHWNQRLQAGTRRGQNMREMRRVRRFGVMDVKPMRSRIQRSTRRRRTGGVK